MLPEEEEDEESVVKQKWAHFPHRSKRLYMYSTAKDQTYQKIVVAAPTTV